jgi:hypothetical protein
MTLPIVVVIDDGNGYRSVYAHFGRIVVENGDRDRAGDLLGYEGATGRASGCHLHYGLFSPVETARFGFRPDVVERMKLPTAEIARAFLVPEARHQRAQDPKPGERGPGLRPRPERAPTPVPVRAPPACLIGRPMTDRPAGLDDLLASLDEPGALTSLPCTRHSGRPHRSRRGGHGSICGTYRYRYASGARASGRPGADGAPGGLTLYVGGIAVEPWADRLPNRLRQAASACAGRTTSIEACSTDRRLGVRIDGHLLDWSADQQRPDHLTGTGNARATRLTRPDGGMLGMAASVDREIAMTWEEADRKSKPVLTGPLCHGTTFDTQQGRMDSKWGWPRTSCPQDL